MVKEPHMWNPLILKNLEDAALIQYTERNKRQQLPT